MLERRPAALDERRLVQPLGVVEQMLDFLDAELGDARNRPFLGVAPLEGLAQGHRNLTPFGNGRIRDKLTASLR